MVELREVIIPDEIEALYEFDRKAFHAFPADIYTPEDWSGCESYRTIRNT